MTNLPSWFDQEQANQAMKVDGSRDADIKKGSMLQMLFTCKVGDKWPEKLLWVLWVMDNDFPHMQDDVYPYRFFATKKEAINTAMLHGITAMEFDELELPDCVFNKVVLRPSWR